MLCYVCDQNNWTTPPNLHTKAEIMVCNDCGTVAHNVDGKDEKKLLEFYRKEYRPAPNYNNILTTSNKERYVKLFLLDFLKGKKGMVTGDVGCATGYLPNFFRTLGHKATGAEYTTTFRRVAEHIYGIPVTEELRTDWKYDLITIYHVLEHMMEPDKKLNQYMSLLKPGGHLFVSTPYWFEDLEEQTGDTIKHFEHHFHTNHINVFSQQSLQNLFAKCKLKIVKQDFKTYGQTYLLRALLPGEEATPIVKEDPKVRIEQLARMKAAIEAHTNKKYKEAIELWPRFPEAHISLIMDTCAKDPIRQEDEWQKTLKVFGEDNMRVLTQFGVWLYQRERYKECLDVLNAVDKSKPNAIVYIYMAWCATNLGMLKEAMFLFNQARTSDPTKWVEATNWMLKIAADIPCWQEVAEEALKEKLIEVNKESLKVDPVKTLVALEQK